jgi:hypothetical protein
MAVTIEMLTAGQESLQEENEQSHHSHDTGHCPP